MDRAKDGGKGGFIRLENISKSYVNSGANIEVLKDLTFDMEAGETIAVVGESGIGKSTFLHVLGTLDRPDRGSLLYKGADVFQYDSAGLADFRNRTMGFVFQFHYLLAEFTALENVMMPGLIQGYSRKGFKETAAAVLVRVGLKNRIHHLIGQLSGGEQQRVALARALVLNPDILLADEPTGNLDKKNSHQVHDLLMELNEEYNMTVVVATHSMNLAGRMKKKMTLIDGKLAEVAI
jgi:lipoprotein-releasing system ATP-binding protein